MGAEEDGRRARKREKTADHITAAAFALFEAQGYDAVTMEQIAAAADVAKGTLYKYFPVKEAIIGHRMRADLAAHAPGMLARFPAEADPVDKLRRLLLASAPYLTQMRAYLPHYLFHRLNCCWRDHQDSESSGMDRLFLALIAEGQARGVLSDRWPAAWLTEQLRFLHLSALLRWLAAPDGDLAAAYDDMLALFLKGCLKEAQA